MTNANAGRREAWGLTTFTVPNSLEFMSHTVRALFTSFYYFGRLADQGGRARA